MTSPVICVFCKKKLREFESDHGMPSHGLCAPCAELHYGIKINQPEVQTG